MMTLPMQQHIWKLGIEAGQIVRRAHDKECKLVIGKMLLQLAFLEAIEVYSDKEDINCFVTGFVNGYLS